MPPEMEDEEEARQCLLALDPGDPAIETQAILAQGAAAAELLRLAEENACDLIVLGSHGRTGLARLLMGSVAEQVLRGAHCPVLVVKRPLAPRGMPTETPQDEEPAIA